MKLSSKKKIQRFKKRIQQEQHLHIDRFVLGDGSFWKNDSKSNSTIVSNNNNTRSIRWYMCTRVISFVYLHFVYIHLETISSATIEAFVFELYSPYTETLQNYANYEQEQLKNALETIQLVGQDDLFRRSGEMIVKIGKERPISCQ